jgi:hypothetical protein
MLRSLAVLVVALFVVSCGATSVCVGTNCTCPGSTTCTFDTCSSTTSNCNLVCRTNATCAGTCGETCNVTCSGSRQCTHTVGLGSNVVCDGASCTITCTDACTVSVSANATAAITCKKGCTVGSLDGTASTTVTCASGNANPTVAGQPTGCAN